MNYRDIETINAFILLLSFDAEKVERKLPIKFKNKLLKLTNAIQPEIDIISKLKADLFQKYGKQSESGETIEILPENKEVFLKEIEEMLSITSECNLRKLDEDETLQIIDDLGLSFTFGDLAFLQSNLFDTRVN
jgi:hypothetical protein